MAGALGDGRAEDRKMLVKNRLYVGDNGRIVCIRCAGCSARNTGKDISGQYLRALPAGHKAKCECSK